MANKGTPGNQGVSGRGRKQKQVVAEKKPLELGAIVWLWISGRLGIATIACFSAALVAVGVKEYAFAAALFLVAAVCLILLPLGWSGIPEHLKLTRICKALLILAGLCMVPFSVLWIYKQKVDEPWSVFLKDDRAAPVSISPMKILVPGGGWTRPSLVTVTNHEEAPRYNLQFQLQQSSADVEYGIEGPTSFSYSTTDGFDYYVIEQIGPKASHVFTIKSKTKSGNGGWIALTVFPGEIEPGASGHMTKGDPRPSPPQATQEPATKNAGRNP